VEKIRGGLDERVTPFCGRTTAAGDHIGDFNVIVVERNRTHSEVEVAVVDKRGIFRRLAIEFRGFRKFGFFAHRGRT
jgi:hypothetical protein